MPTEEHDPKAEESGGQASQAGVSQNEGAPISLDDATVQALISHPKINEYFRAEALKAGQTVKDRRFAGIEKDLETIFGQLQLSPEQQTQYKEQLQQAVEKNQGQGVSQNQAANQASGKQVDIVGAFSKAGYDINQVSLADWEFAEGFTGDGVALANALAKRKLEGQKEGAPPSNSAAMPAGSNVATPTPGSQDALMREYTDKLKKIRPGDVGSVTALKAEYRKKGLSIF